MVLRSTWQKLANSLAVKSSGGAASSDSINSFFMSPSCSTKSRGVSTLFCRAPLGRKVLPRGRGRGPADSELLPPAAGLRIDGDARYRALEGPDRRPSGRVGRPASIEEA